MKIGIIGSGISGLTAAFELGKLGHQVSLFEQRDRIGMSAHGFSVGETGVLANSVDVPSRLLNAHHWPKLLDLYNEAGVETEAVNPTQTYTDSNNLPYLQIDPTNLFGFKSLSLSNTRLPKMIWELGRLRDQAERDLAGGIDNRVTLDQYLSGLDISKQLKIGFIYPLLSSTVCTCSFQSIANYPAKLVLEILNDLNQAKDANVPLLRTRHGSVDVAEKLLQFNPLVMCGRKVDSLVLKNRSVELTSVVLSNDSNFGDKKVYQFDHVIVATQANHALRILPSECTDEIAALKQIAYEDVEVVVHSDESLLPANQNCWSTFNFCVDGNPKRASRSTCNIWLNQFYGFARDTQRNWFQAINPIVTPDPDHIVSRVHLQRPIVTARNFEAWKQLQKLQHDPNRRIWMAGSYASAGIPLLESGVVSAKSVVARVELASTEVIKS